MKSVLSAAFSVYFGLSVSALAEDIVYLTTEDLGRGQLAKIAAELAEPGTKGVGLPFTFPDDVRKDSTYGVDISHHSFVDGVTFKWSEMTSIGVSFVYAKATQGERFVDRTFTDTWRALAAVDGLALPRRGAYHFLTANGDPEVQANHFLKVLKSSGGYVPNRDMPPVLDLEWDCRVVKKRVVLDNNGRCYDLWISVEPAEIVRRVKLFSDRVENTIGVKPIIYTAQTWWEAAGLAGQLQEHTLWIADYTKRAQKSGQPRVPDDYIAPLWQFTDNGKIHEFCVPTHAKKKILCNDVNIFKGDTGLFNNTFALTK